MVVVKNGRGLLRHGTLKSAVSQEWIDELSSFFICWYKFRKGTSYLNNWVGVLKNGWGLLACGAEKSAVLQEWYQVRSLIDFCLLIIVWYSDAIIFGLTANLVCMFDF